ncbi:uncharacterized protein LOC115761507 [Drosophila novamexicana]|uniref:uncharacterized protein LOC115761507 n=1 Tax=Drosophila novamexicana TaxID=47314 RepID=UPI0011E5BB0B|nr:uncharacterized protein LOC115761507 [Drosophila novamexicana]
MQEHFPTILQLLIAAAALIFHCVADVAHINQAAPKDVLVPFNDLLPPPLEESTTEASTPATKPTKKSYYQQQQQARTKETVIRAELPSAKQPALALDLLPPFAEDVVQPQVEAASSSSISKTTVAAVTTQQPPFVSSTSARSVPHVAQPQQLSARVEARTNSIDSGTSGSSRFSSELIRQYATYFQSTTPRPPRGPLPTLTPFPRHIKI